MKHYPLRNPIFLACLLLLTGFAFAPTQIAQAQAELEGISTILTGKASDTATEEAATPDRVIETDNTADDDKLIKERLSQIFSVLDTLSKVTIEVKSGVVTLRGEVESATVETRALRFARQVNGVVGVENQLTIDRSLERRLDTTRNKIINTGRDILANLPLLAVAILIIALFWWLGSWLANRKKLYTLFTDNEFIGQLLGQLTKLVFIIAGIILALMILDATPLIGTILGAAGILGLSISFAVRDTVENYISSILLSVRNPFEVNDHIRIDNYEGNVARLNSRATILLSADGTQIRIPNAMVFKAVIINYTRNPKRRFSFPISVSTAQEIVPVQALAVNVLNELEGVMEQPRPTAIIKNASAGQIDLDVSGWVDQVNFSHERVRGEAIRKVRESFEQHGVVWPSSLQQIELRRSQTGHTASQRPLITAPEVESEITDLRADKTIKQQVIEAQNQNTGENLLKPEAPKE